MLVNGKACYNSNKTGHRLWRSTRAGQQWSQKKSYFSLSEVLSLEDADPWDPTEGFALTLGPPRILQVLNAFPTEALLPGKGQAHSAHGESHGNF